MFMFSCEDTGVQTAQVGNSQARLDTVPGNNPGGLMHYGIEWNGLSNPKTDNYGHARFISWDLGVRANYLNLRKKIVVDKITTIDQLVGIWPNENKRSSWKAAFTQQYKRSILVRTPGVLTDVEARLILRAITFAEYSKLIPVMRYQKGISLAKDPSKATVSESNGGYILNLASFETSPFNPLRSH